MALDWIQVIYLLRASRINHQYINDLWLQAPGSERLLALHETSLAVFSTRSGYILALPSHSTTARVSEKATTRYVEMAEIGLAPGR